MPTQFGSPNDDILPGTPSTDKIDGLAGNDTISGGLGLDWLIGGLGNDTLDGGLGGDKLDGGKGIDTADYTTSAAQVSVDLAFTKKQVSTGYASGDLLIAIENVTGSDTGGDTLKGNKSANYLNGMGGNDTLDGRAGADILEGGRGADKLIGGKGSDTAYYGTSDAAIQLDLRKTAAQLGGDAAGDKLSGIENADGSISDDTIYGTKKSNIISGGIGADKLYGLGGTDTASYVTSQLGVTVNLSKALQTSLGDAKGDRLFSFENIMGSAFDDTLTGTKGANLFIGGKGADKIFGGAGSDTMSYAGSASVVVDLFFHEAGSADDGSGDTLNSIENLIGSGNYDSLRGDAGANRINGGAGNDIVGGNSILGDFTGTPAKDKDVLTGGKGDDQFEFNTNFGHDTITDFKPGAKSGDVIVMGSIYGHADVHDFIASGHQVGANVVFTFGDNVLTLLHVKKAALLDSDFSFFA